MSLEEKMSELAPSDLATVSEAVAAERAKRDDAAFMRRDPSTMHRQDFDRWARQQIEQAERARARAAEPEPDKSAPVAAQERPMPAQPAEDVASLDDLVAANAERAAKAEEDATRRVFRIQQEEAQKRESEWMHSNLGRLTEAELLAFRIKTYGF